MGLDERSGHFWLDPLRIAGKETEDLHPLIGSAKGGEKAGVDRTSDTRLGGGMVHGKAACGRVSDKEDQEGRREGEAPGRKRSLRSDQMGDQIFKRD